MKQRVIAIDPKNDLQNIRNIDKSIHIIDINNIRDGALNPFTFLSNVDTSTIITIIEFICGKLSNDDERAITPIIQDFVIRFRRDKEYVDMNAVAEYLFSRDNRNAINVGSRLRAYADNQYGKLLFTREENVEPLHLSDTDSMVITLHGMDIPDYSVKVEDYTPKQRFTSAIIYILTLKLLEILSSKNNVPTVFCCDEAHLLFGNKEMSKIIDRFLVIGRSLGFATMLASQGVSHFPAGIANHISSKFSFRTSIDEAKLFLEKFDTTVFGDNAIDRTSVVGTISNLELGTAFMIDNDGNSGVFKVKPNYPLYLLTGKEEDKGK